MRARGLTLLLCVLAGTATACANDSRAETAPEGKPTTPSEGAHDEFVVGYVPAAFHKVDDTDAMPAPAVDQQQAFTTNGSLTTRRTLTVHLLRSDAVSTVRTYAAENGHLRRTPIGGRPGAVGWNVAHHARTGLHLAYVVWANGYAIEVVERDGRDAHALSDEELVRVAASVQSA